MSRPCSGSSTSRLLRQEEALVRRRNAQQDHQQMWNDVSRYFHNSEVRCAKHEEWTSPRYYTSSEETRAKEKEAEEHAEKLMERRSKLTQLLREEALEHLLALKALPRHPVRKQQPSLEELRNINWEIKHREEESRRQQAELLLYHQWRQKQPAITQFQRKLHTRFVKEAWAEQREQHHKEEEERQQQEEEAALLEREEREQEERRLQQEEKERRSQRTQQLREQLEKQIKELKQQEALSEELQREEAENVQRQSKLEEVLEQQRLVEERRQKQELRSFLNHQYDLKLRKRAREVQEALAEDRQVLVALLASLAEEKTRKDERLLAARQELEAIQHQLEVQTRREKERERQMGFMFEEEARRMWKEQEARWQSEQEARSKLVAQVVAVQKQQVSEKLKRNLEEQRALLRCREELLAQVEEADEELREATAAEEQTRLLTKLDIDQQVREKQSQQQEQARREQAEAERKQEEIRHEEERIQQELKLMERQGYRPQSVARRRILW